MAKKKVVKKDPTPILGGNNDFHTDGIDMAVNEPRTDQETMAQLGKVEVRDTAGRLLFCYNPTTDLIEIKSHGSMFTVDFSSVRAMAKRNILSTETKLNLSIRAYPMGKEDHREWLVDTQEPIPVQIPDLGGENVFSVSRTDSEDEAPSSLLEVDEE